MVLEPGDGAGRIHRLLTAQKGTAVQGLSPEKGRPVYKGECGVVGVQGRLENQLLTSPQVSLLMS